MAIKRALVTGAYGFIGRHVCRQLQRSGWLVVAIGHGSWSRDEWRTWGIDEWHLADVTLASLSTYAGAPEVIVHCAGSGSVGYSMSHPYQDYERSVATTATVLEFARTMAPAARVVLPSSAGVYGAVEALPIGESAPLRPVSAYGVHKLLAEELCRSSARHFGVACAIVRLFSVFGPGLRKQLLWDACVKVARNEPEFSGTGEELRDWLHVEDAAALLIAAAQHAGERCPAVNGGTGTGATTREVLEEVFAQFQRSGTPCFSRDQRPGDPQRYQADVKGATQWGWAPRRTWREGVREYVSWFKEQHR